MTVYFHLHQDILENVG